MAKRLQTMDKIRILVTEGNLDSLRNSKNKVFIDRMENIFYEMENLGKADPAFSDLMKISQKLNCASSLVKSIAVARRRVFLDMSYSKM